MGFNEEARKAYEARRNAVEALRAFGDEVGERAFTNEDTEQFERMNAEVDRLDGQVSHWLNEGRLQERSAALDALIGVQSDSGKRDADDGLTPIEREARDLFVPEARSAVFTAPQAEINRLHRRDLTAGTATDGKEFVPTTLFGELYSSLREGATSMFTLGRSIITAGGEAMDFPVATAFSTAALVAEAGVITESDPQFATVTLNAYKYALAIQISHELEADNAVPGALPWVVEQAVDGIRRGVGAALVTADGASKPNGVDNATNVFMLAGIVAPTADELVRASHDITTPYRANASWLMNDATLLAARLLKDADGQYIWQPGLLAGAPDRLLGAPVHTDSAIEVAGANRKVAVYGDISRAYMVRTVGSIRAERSVDYAFLNDLATWRFIGRFDGEIIDNNAVTVLTNAAA